MNSAKIWIIVEYANAAQTTRNINEKYGADKLMNVCPIPQWKF